MENKAVLFLSHLIPHERYDEVLRHASNNMQDAANALQWRLVDGFAHHLDGDFRVVNMMPIASYPRYYDQALVRGSRFDAKAKVPGISIGHNNMKYIRKISITKNLHRELKRWAAENREKSRTVIVYSLNASMLKAVAKLKRSCPDLTVCAIVADLPDMIDLSSKRGLLRRLAGKVLADQSYANLQAVDRFVLLTEPMAEYLGIHKPYCVMEGISTGEFPDILPEDRSDLKMVLYTGTLHRKFGVLHLLEAFQQISDPDYRLVICGAGDSEQELRRAARQDSRIMFMGQCRRSEVLKLQKSATVLVNPRKNNEEFTKYSFPSKNMEYLSSGTPLIAYKLDGIPDDYDGYIIYPQDDTAQALAAQITSVCGMEPEERARLGQKGRQFVAQWKNPVAQTRKIMELLELPVKDL